MEIEQRLALLRGVVEELQQPVPLANLLVGRLVQVGAPDHLIDAARALAELVKAQFP
jgi:hypothetical protein